ncbi:hypothetical protein MK489_14490 [Myxococcota bacterium]|nr:hypothetical protein [Myxococcota bacterium]
MFSALWGCALFLGLTAGIGMEAAASLLFAVNVYLAISHSWSTTYMVVASPLLREERRLDRRKWTYIPLAVVGFSLLLGVGIGVYDAFPHTFPLTSSQWLWGVYLGLFWVGHFWHFGNQDFGVLSIYRLKAGQTGRRDRLIDKGFAVVMMFVIQPFVYLKAVTNSPFQEAFFSYVPLSRDFVAVGAEIALIAAVALTLVVMGIEIAKGDTSIPKLLYYFVMLAHPAILYFTHYKLAFFYIISYFWSHWLIAIGLVGLINTNYYRTLGFGAPGSLYRHVRALSLIVVVAAIFHHYFFMFNKFSGGDYKEILGQVPPQFALIVGLVLGVFLAEQLLHYYCDRCLFRFRDPAVRKRVSPLL